MSGFSIRVASFDVEAGTIEFGQHSCGNGPRDRVFGGGFSVSGDTSSYGVLDNRPNSDNRWIVRVDNRSRFNPITVTFYAICGQVS